MYSSEKKAKTHVKGKCNPPSNDSNDHEIIHQSSNSPNPTHESIDPPMATKSPGRATKPML
jgi:hypothetical protein